VASCCSAIGLLDGLVGCGVVEIVIEEEFEVFVRDAEPRLRRALIGAVGVDRVPDAVGEALAYAFTHWSEVRVMDNAVGFLYRVGQSRSRPRKRLRVLLRAEPVGLPDVEPGLPAALAALPPSQRAAVWLAHGCDWTHAEIAESLEVSTSTVATHVARGLARLRSELGVTV
jgi:DNA-directed RNA polymerase specialized sigma24 family protein